MKQIKGLILVFTGNGKGKTSAAVGCAVRMIKHGKRVGMVQFFKSPSKHILPHDKFRVWSFGGGFTWQVSRAENIKTAQNAWRQCLALLRHPRYDLIIFDEIHIALRYRFLKILEVIKALKQRPSRKHVILTGRGAPKALCKIADLVTEMKCIKHPYQKGICAQAGIEF